MRGSAVKEVVLNEHFLKLPLFVFNDPQYEILSSFCILNPQEPSYASVHEKESPRKKRTLHIYAKKEKRLTVHNQMHTIALMQI